MVDVSQSSRTLYRNSASLSFAPIMDSPADTLEPWLLTENDLPWLRIIFGKKYDRRYDAFATEGWFRNIVLKNPMMFYAVRLDNSLLIAMLSCLPWIPTEFECHVVCVCAEDGAMWETLKLLRASIDWARDRKCKRWLLTSDTEYDLAPMARRLEVNELTPRFSLEL